MGFLDFIFGTKKRQIDELVEKGAAILDVRTTEEWDRGHIDDAIHIPLGDLKERLHEVKQLDRPIITCCASGVRSGKAAKYLNLQNIKAVNGGGWMRLKKRL